MAVRPHLDDLWYRFLEGYLDGTIPGIGGGDTLVSGRVVLTNTTAGTVIAAVAGHKIAVTSVLVVNADDVDSTRVEIRDGTTVKMQGLASADGGGWSHRAHGPMFEGTENTAITARCVSAGADVDVFISGYLIPV